MHRHRFVYLALALAGATGGCFQDPGRAGESSSEGATSNETTQTESESSSTTGPGMCGDGVVDQGEECDEGADNGDNNACTSQCRDNVCGDGLLHDGVEACDEVTDTMDCDADCTLVECGDGYVNTVAGEACEDDPQNATCDASCQAVCNPGFASCDAAPGCETPVFDDPNNCGGCNVACAAGVECRVGTCGAKRVFVTDAVYPISDFAGGFAAIHTICQDEAVAANIGDGTYRAWVSDGGTPGGPEGFTPSTTPYVRMDGAIIAADFADLTDGSIDNPINLNASGGVPNVTGGNCQGGTAVCPLVYSGIAADGSSGGSNCSVWTDASGTFVPGNMTATDATWTFGTISLQCGTPARLFCFEQ